MANYYQEYLKLKRQQDMQNNGIVTPEKWKEIVEWQRTHDSQVAAMRDEYNARKLAEKKKQEEEKEDGLSFVDSGAFGDEKGNFFTDLADTIGGTMVDFVMSPVKGLLNTAEGIVDLAAYGVGGVADLLGADDFAEGVRDVARFEAINKAYEGLGINDVIENSVFGDTSRAILEGVGQVGAMIASGGAASAAGVSATAVTTGTMFASSAGQGISEAYKGGATDGEATAYGLTKGAIDAATERMFGAGKLFSKVGLNSGFLNADDWLATAAGKAIKNKVGKTLVQMGIKATAEGVEEVAAAYFTAHAKKGTYQSEEEFEKILEDEKRLEQFIVGAAVGGIMQGGSGVQSIQSGRDMISGLTENEQSVLDMEIENRIKAAEKEGTELSKKDKKKIHEDAKRDLERGYISIDTIESTLSPMTYDRYKKVVDNETKLEKEISELENLRKEEITVKQSERLQEARQELKELRAKDEKSSLKSMLNDEVRKATENDAYLAESYNERARRGKKFEANVEEYEEAQRETIQKAIDSGVLNNSNKTHAFVDLMAKLAADKGIKIDFANNKKIQESGFAVEGKTINGYVKGDNIVLNVSSDTAIRKVVGHEITHILEGTEMYAELQQAVKQYAETRGEYEARLQEIQSNYENVENANIENELTADLVGEYLFTDENFINNLSTEQPNIFKRIYNEIKYFVKQVIPGSQEAKQLEKVKRIFDKAYKENVEIQENENANYSLYANYKEEVDKWYNDENEYAKAGGFFKIGRTSEALKSIDVKEQEILFDKAKIKKILKEHDGMSIDIIKEVPNIVESPILVMQSKTVTNSITLFGEVYADGVPVMVAMQLKPKGKGSRVLNIIKIASAYERSDAQGLIDTSDILYVEPNKNRTDTWLRALGLQLPAGLTTYGPIAKVTYYEDVVKNESVGNNVMREALAKMQSSSENTKLSLSSKDGTAPHDPSQIYGSDLIYDPTLDESPMIEDDLGPVREVTPMTPDDMGPVRDDLATSQEINMPDDLPIRSDIPTANKKKKVKKPNKSDFISEKANELYQELENLQNQEEASAELKDLLSYGYSVKDIRNALKNAIVKPTEKSVSGDWAEDVVREKLEEAYNNLEGEEYVDINSELPDDLPIRDDLAPNLEILFKPIMNVKDRNAANLEARKVELARMKQLKDSVEKEHIRRIAELQRKLNIKKDKNSKVARKLEQQIIKEKRLKEEDNNLYEQKINTLTERIKKMNSPEFKVAEQRQYKTEQRQQTMGKLMGDTSTWKDKSMGLQYSVNTLKRNLRDVVRDEHGNRDIAKADAIYDFLMGSYNRNEAKLNREANRIRKQFKDLKINKWEDRYIQMLGEYKYNPDTTLTNEVVDEFYQKHKSKIDTAKVDKAIDMARATYDDLFKRVNEVLKAEGMKEIPYREGYFPHFTQEQQGFFGKLLNWKKVDNSIPTDIAGLTEQFKPSKSYQSFAQHRHGDTTDYSVLKGLDSYTQGALDWIYHIGDIQNFRAFENEIRYRHSEAHVQEQIKKIDNDETLDAEQAQALKDGLFAEAKNPLNNLVQNIRTHTNLLAGKKNTMDRNVESETNRQIYSFSKNISSRVTVNMVGASISSALTNFIPITQSWGEVSPRSTLKAMKATLQSIIKDDGTIDKSDFLTNRLKPADTLSKTVGDKVTEKAFAMMSAVDYFTAQTIWRSKYMENIDNGMSENEAIKDADNFAEGVMAGRSRGNMPVLMEAKNPLIKMYTAFQLEVSNQYGYMFKDMPQNMKNKTSGKLIKAYGAMFLGAYAYNALFSQLTGRNAAFDPLRIIEELLRDLGLGGDDEEEGITDAIMDLGGNIVDELPFVGTLTGGGRIPMSSALPYDNVVDMVTGTAEDVKNGNWGNLTKEWLNPFYYLVLPVGGGQIKKTNEGLAMFDDDLPISGSYTNTGNLRYAVEDTPLNRIQAGLFGQWANENAQDYIDNERQTMKSKQIEEFAELHDLGMTQKEYWDYRDGLKELDTLSEKVDYIVDLDFSTEQKNIMVNNLVDRKEKIDISNYDDFSDYEEFDFYLKNPEKHSLSKAIGTFKDYNTYTKALSNLKSDKDESGNSVSGSRKKKVIQYINNLDASYETKIILYKMEYPSDNRYNKEIIEYLNQREDISYKDMETILKELGFKVEPNGTIRW